MKWIKASERLPDKSGLHHCRFLYDGKPFRPLLLSKEELAQCRERTDNVEIEWLSESESPLSNSEYQLCPKCNGQGTVSKPPYIAGDVFHWTAGQSSFECDVCNGKKIIERPPSETISTISKQAEQKTKISKGRNPMSI